MFRFFLIPTHVWKFTRWKRVKFWIFAKNRIFFHFIKAILCLDGTLISIVTPKSIKIQISWIFRNFDSLIMKFQHLHVRKNFRSQVEIKKANHGELVWEFFYHKKPFVYTSEGSCRKDEFFSFRKIGALNHGRPRQDIYQNVFSGHTGRLKFWLGKGFDHFR